MVHKTFCFAVFFYYYILLFFTVSTQNSFTKIKSVLRFLTVCRTVLGGRNTHDGFENTVKMIDIIETTGETNLGNTGSRIDQHSSSVSQTNFIQRTHNGVITQYHAGQNGGIHTDPAVFAEHDVFAGLMLLQIGQHMVRRDKTDIRRDITTFANDDFGGEILKIAAERVKIVHIIRVENQIFRAAYFIAERNRERNIAIDALYLLHPQVSLAPCPAETGFLKPAATQKLFIVKQRHNKF